MVGMWRWLRCAGRRCDYHFVVQEAAGGCLTPNISPIGQKFLLLEPHFFVFKFCSLEAVTDTLMWTKRESVLYQEEQGHTRGLGAFCRAVWRLTRSFFPAGWTGLRAGGLWFCWIETQTFDGCIWSSNNVSLLFIFTGNSQASYSWPKWSSENNPITNFKTSAYY